jgi:hypothetical protein
MKKYFGLIVIVICIVAIFIGCDSSTNNVLKQEVDGVHLGSSVINLGGVYPNEALLICEWYQYDRTKTLFKISISTNKPSEFETLYEDLTYTEFKKVLKTKFNTSIELKNI